MDRDPLIRRTPDHDTPPREEFSLQLAYFGLRERIANWRMERAGAWMEQMDHQTALFSDLENEATGNAAQAPHETASGHAAEPRNTAELIMAQISANSPMKQAEAKRVKKTFGGTATRPESAVPIISKRKSKAAHQETIGGIMQFREQHREEHPEMYEQPGDSPAVIEQKKRDLARAFYQYTHNGQLGKIQQGAQDKVATQNLEQKRYSSKERRLNKLKTRSVKRRDEAIGKIQKRHEQAKRYRQQQAELVSSRNDSSTSTT